ncbi:FISUMP domain-containing protein [Reichenbachiella versicolor]|uniref:FISUMP domain-containing protein n=1 Tax=Reichenbachiella versicolor TaxID=1821036 RepID=UPI000D6E99D2|nr:FISUMP domain-containing protein [Reichenbachiella versicolor]
MKSLLTFSFATLAWFQIQAQDMGIMYDDRDGQEYETILLTFEVDGVLLTNEWIASNLNYESEESKCYKNYPEYCNTYGRLYSWKDAKSICPQGWHLSSDKEWKLVIDKFGTKAIAANTLREGGDSNLNLIPAGFGEKGGQFIDIGVNGYYWKSDDKFSSTPGTITIHRGVEYITDDQVDETHYNSVRCVRD